MDWVDFTTENANGTARKTGKFAKFLQRDQAGMEAPFEIYWPEISQTGVAHPTYGAVKQRRHIWVPTGAFRFLLHFEGKVSGSTGYLQLDLGGLVEEITFTATSYGFVAVQWDDVRSLRGQSVDLELKLSNASSSATTYARSGESQFDAPAADAGGKKPGAGRLVCAMFRGPA